MVWLAYVVSFAAGFGIGAWRAGRSSRRPLALAAMLPLVLVLLSGLMVLYLRVTATGTGDMHEFAYIMVSLTGAFMALCALAGGMIGVMYRRAGPNTR